MNYRLLPAEEYERLKFIFEPRSLPLPDPLIEKVGVAEDGAIVAMIIQRFLPLIDGLWVAPQYRGGRVNYKQLGGLIEELFTHLPGSRLYALGTGKHVRRIALECGYKELEWKVLEKGF